MELMEYKNKFEEFANKLREMETDIVNNGFVDCSRDFDISTGNFLTTKSSYWLKNGNQMSKYIGDFVNGVITRTWDDNDTVKYVACLMIYVIDTVHLLMPNDAMLSFDKYRLPLENIMLLNELTQTIYDRRAERHIEDIHSIIDNKGEEHEEL